MSVAAVVLAVALLIAETTLVWALSGAVGVAAVVALVSATTLLRARRHPALGQVPQ